MVEHSDETFQTFFCKRRQRVKEGRFRGQVLKGMAASGLVKQRRRQFVLTTAR